MITCNTGTLYLIHLQRPFFPKEQFDPQQRVGGICECDIRCDAPVGWRQLHPKWPLMLLRIFSSCVFTSVNVNCLLWMCVFTQVCVTDQRAESLRRVSTGDARGVHSDLHHLLHVGRRRLTCVKLPSWPSFRVPQTPTHIKLTLSQQRQEEHHCSNGGGLGSHTGQTGRRERLSHISHVFNPSLPTQAQGYLLFSIWASPSQSSQP